MCSVSSRAHWRADGTNDVAARDWPHGQNSADLTIGADVAGCKVLLANQGLSSRGTQLFGAGFIVSEEEIKNLGAGAQGVVIREYRNGRDITQSPRGVYVIDLFGLTEQEVRDRYPAIYEWVYNRVKPERDQNRRASYREKWWIHGEPRAQPPRLRLPVCHVTLRQSKRLSIASLCFWTSRTAGQQACRDRAGRRLYVLGVLSSRIHVDWALAAGSHLGVGNDPCICEIRLF